MKGVGAFFVLPPRALPAEDRGRVIVLDRRAPRAVAQKLSKEQEQELRAMQAQVEAMQRDADAMQREAERALESVERNVRIRLLAPGAARPRPLRSPPSSRIRAPTRPKPRPRLPGDSGSARASRATTARRSGSSPTSRAR